MEDVEIAIIEGTTYYKCTKCGAIGNWLERIASGECHTSIVGDADVTADERASS